MPVPVLPAGAAVVTGDEIAATAQSHIGHPYVWGGWDCSGMVSHVLSAQLGLAIPGYGPGQFQGPPPHGPVVSDYIAWRGARTIPGPPEPGDLVCFGPDVHIGIAISATRMVSALNPKLGTQDTPISSTASGQVIYRRVLRAIPGGRTGRRVRASSAASSSATAVAGRLVLVLGLVAGGVLLVAGAAAYAVGAVTSGILAGGRQRPVTKGKP